MNELVISSAELAFGAAGLLITISLIVLNFAWKALREMVSSLPEDQRRVFRNLRSIQDKRERNKANLIIIHFTGCMCFVACIALAVIAMSGVISVMLGYKLGFYQQENYESCRACLFISVLFFTGGFYALGVSYLDKVISLITGKPELLTTDLRTLPPLTAPQIAEIGRFERYIALFLIMPLILFFILELFNPFSTWIKMLVALGATALLFLIIMLIRRIRSK